MSNQKEKKGLNISAKSFVTAIVIIFVLMIITYILTFIIPGGNMPFWKWALSPVLVLGAKGNGATIAVIAFLLVIGGIFNGLEKCGLMKYMLDKMTARFGNKRYTLMAVVTLFFMALGSFIGSFEECVPLVPIVVALAINLGWDALVGMGMSILAIGCGFAAGICNPFTVGVAQELVGLPMFSGMWFRGISFVLIYAILLGFLYFYAKRIERPVSSDPQGQSFVQNTAMDKGLACFAGILCLGIAVVASSAIFVVLQDYTMVIVAVMFLVAGIVSVCVAGMSFRQLGATFWNGLISVLPAVFMILMANSIKYTLEEGQILEPILDGAEQVAGMLPKWGVILFIYLIVLSMNFFIPSGSAKAVLLLPMIAPVAEMFGISLQLCVVAYAFGDGFSNVFYPTNPVLLISLGLSDVSYGKWVKWSWKFQAMNLILTSLILFVGLAIGY